MKKTELTTAVNRNMETTHEALQLIWDYTNKGQRKKLLKNEDIAALLQRYNVNTEE